MWLKEEDQAVVDRWAAPKKRSAFKTADFRVVGLTKDGRRLLLAVGRSKTIAKLYAADHRQELEKDGVEFEYELLEVWDQERWRPW